jgi:hypothetical protein
MFDKTHIIQLPTGRWGFVGRVPVALAYQQEDGSEPTAKQAEIIRGFGPRLAGVKARVYETRLEAHNALQDFELRQAYEGRPIQ